MSLSSFGIALPTPFQLTIGIVILIFPLLADKYLHRKRGINSLPTRELCPSTIPDQNEVVAFSGKCLEFVEIERTWHIAQLDCSSKGGNLIQIRSEGFQNFVMSTLKSMKWNRNSLWIGAHDIAREGEWEWITGEAVTWSNWAQGQPSCYLPQIKIFCAEDCAVLRYGSGGKWHDYRCNSAAFKYSYICQYDLNTAATNSSESLAPSINSSVVTSVDPTIDLNKTDIYDADYTTGPTTDYILDTTTVNSSDSQTENSIDIYQNSAEYSIESTSETVTDSTESPDNSSDSYDWSSTDHKTPTDNVYNSTTELDFVEVETKSSLWETTHIIIEDGDLPNDGDDDEKFPSIKAAHEKNQETKSVGLTGPLLGSILGLCLVCVVVVLSFYIYKKRCTRDQYTWSVGFDNPNYGSQEVPDCRAERKLENGGMTN